MNSMFDQSTIASVNFGDNFNTNHVTNMTNMFNFCSELEDLNISGFITKFKSIGNKKENVYYQETLLTADVAKDVH